MTQPPQFPEGQFPYPQIPDPGYPQFAPPPPPKPPMSPQKKGMLVVAGALGVFLAAILVLGIVRATTGPDDSPQAAVSAGDFSGAPALSNDEQQIRQTIVDMGKAAKANNLKKMASYFCAKYRDVLEAIGEKELPDLSSLTKSKTGPGKITSIDVDGKDAVVHVEDSEGKHDLQFKKESGDWKFCPKL